MGKFREIVQHAGYSIETTAPDSSFQNRVVERAHRTLAKRMQAMLHGTGLPAPYWTYAIRHTVYLLNRLPHRAISKGTTPFQRFTGRRPDLHHLRIFGSRVIVRKVGGCRFKIDEEQTPTGIFLGSTGTDWNIHYKDSVTMQIKTSRHHTFDECHYSSGAHLPFSKDLLRTPNDTPPAPSIPTRVPAVNPVPTDAPTPSLAGSHSNPIALRVSHNPTDAPTEFELSPLPYRPSLNISLPSASPHKTLGMNLIQQGSRVIAHDMEPGEPTHKIPR